LSGWVVSPVRPRAPIARSTFNSEHHGQGNCPRDARFKKFVPHDGGPQIREGSRGHISKRM
jgi:hypothetical protein